MARVIRMRSEICSPMGIHDQAICITLMFTIISFNLNQFQVRLGRDRLRKIQTRNRVRLFSLFFGTGGWAKKKSKQQIYVPD